MRIVQANPRFELSVEPGGACVGCYLTDLLPSSRLASTLVSAARDGTPFANIEVCLSRPTNRTVQVTGAALAAGEQRGWVISLSDLTEHKRLEGLKEEFIDIAAHELRTPLAIILGFASVLSEDLAESQDASALAPIEAIVGAANRLKMIINEWWNLPRPEATQRVRRRRWINSICGRWLSTLSAPCTIRLARWASASSSRPPAGRS